MRGEQRRAHMERMVPYSPYRSRGGRVISPLVKYTMFFFNFIFWLFGGGLIGIGFYALIDQWQSSDKVRIDSIADVLFNIGLLFCIVGTLVFFVSFAGCIGALRENTLLLKLYSIALLIFFLTELGIAILCFIFPHKVEGMASDYLTDNVIKKYREDADLQNLIDFIQQEFKCCGLSSKHYEDWSKNEYFNCTGPNLNPSVERCGVPYSCCKNATDMSSGLINIMCGYGVQEPPSSPAKEARLRGASFLHTETKDKIWNVGCIDAIKQFLSFNSYIVAGVALGVALMQLFVMYLAKSLEGQIEIQKSY